MEEQLLEVWSNRVGEGGLPRYTYPEVKEMLESGDFSRVPGWGVQTDRLREAMECWVGEMERGDWEDL